MVTCVWQVSLHQATIFHPAFHWPCPAGTRDVLAGGSRSYFLPALHLYFLHPAAYSSNTTTCRAPSRAVDALSGHPRGSRGESMHNAASELPRITLLKLSKKSLSSVS